MKRQVRLEEAAKRLLDATRCEGLAHATSLDGQTDARDEVVAERCKRCRSDEGGSADAGGGGKTSYFPVIRSIGVGGNCRETR